MLVLFEGSEQKDKMGDVMFKVEIVIMLSLNALIFFFFFFYTYGVVGMNEGRETSTVLTTIKIMLPK